MSDRSITHTVLHRSADRIDATIFVTGMVDCHDYDHAEQCFEDEQRGQVILGIYEGDVTRKDAIDRYIEENTK